MSAVPDGPREEFVLFHEENEGLMPFGLPHQSHHCKNQKGWVERRTSIEASCGRSARRSRT